MKLYFILFLLSVSGMKAAKAAAAAIAGAVTGTSDHGDQLLLKANNQFTAQMFSEVTGGKKGQSVVLSAFSVLTPLAQLTLASGGATHEELLKAIGLPSDDSIKEVFPKVNNELRKVNDKDVTLKQAARIYVANNAKLNAKFQEESAKIFGSDVKNVDFTKNTDAAKEINSWVETNTNNKIKELVSADSLNAMTRAVLVNAIYFKGAWKHKFDPAHTEDRDFHVTKTETKKIPTMFMRENLEYAESEELNAKLLRLPYGKEGTSSMIIVLPNEIDGLDALLQKLKDPEALPNAIKKMSSFDVEVFLPKFKIETETDLKEVLTKMNVRTIFGSSADLKNLFENEENVFIDKAIQKAFIEVSEEGTEAAAANEFGFVGYSAIVYESRQFVANHPFYFSLGDADQTLFSGVFWSA